MRTYKSIKASCWRYFAKYILLRYARDGGWVSCVTCGRQYQVDSPDIHAGHLLAGRSNSILFEEDAVFPQCVICNCFKDGNEKVFKAWYINKFGEDKYWEMMRLKNKVVWFTEDELLQKEEYYRNQCKRLREEKGC